MEECELPVGWASAILSDLIASDGEFSDGDWVESKDQDPNGNIRLLQLADIGDAKFLDKSARFVNEVKFAELRCTEVLENDVLIARMPDPLGRACQVPPLQQKAITVVDIAIVRPGINSVDPKWLMHAINSPVMRETIAIQSTGTTRRRIARGKLADLQFPLPPCNEQKRIAAKLDTTLAAVVACRQRLDGVAAILKRFRQAVLAAATSGELTREWREERSREEAWQQKTIDQIANVGTGSTPLRSNPAFYDSTGIPWITSAATSVELITSASECVTEEGQSASRLRLYPEGTLLVAMYGEGKTRGQVSELGIAATINQACAAIHDPIEPYLMPFIKIVLKANYLQMRVLAEGGNQPNLNLSKIKQFPIALPSKDEIFEICDRVETFFTLADQLEAHLTTARKIVDRLTPALLTKAFRGELVPQDPNDEPASVLLERIRAARQAEGGAGKSSGRGQKKAAAHPDQLPLDAAPVPPDLLSGLLRECGALSERALLAASELDAGRFRRQLEHELKAGSIRDTNEEGKSLLEAVEAP